MCVCVCEREREREREIKKGEGGWKYVKKRCSDARFFAITFTWFDSWVLFCFSFVFFVF